MIGTFFIFILYCFLKKKSYFCNSMNSIEMKNIYEIRRDFPILDTEVNGEKLVYLDNAATTQKPQKVIDHMVDYYTNCNANIHRGVHALSQRATQMYEDAREKVKKFIGAEENCQVIFTYGTTFSINLLASCLKNEIDKGDEIWVLSTEHHSNIVPWQFLCQRTGAVIKNIPIKDDGTILWEEFEQAFTQKMKVLSVQHISNALGNVYPIEEIIRKAKSVGAITIVDGAQAVGHKKIDVLELDVDFYVSSGHKMYAPTGIGFLYGKKHMLEKLPPYQGGGDMIKTVSFQKTTYADLPYRFEAGTPNICGAIALGFAIDYINELGIENIQRYEHSLLEYCTQRLGEFDNMKIYGNKDLSQRAGVVSFNIDGIHPYDVGVVLDKMGIAVRTGHHCTQPTMDFYNIPGTVRASFALYNTKEEVDKLCEGVEKAINMLG